MRRTRFLAALAITVASSAVAVGGAAVGGAAPAAAAPSGIEWICNPAMDSDPCDLPSDTTDLLTGEVAAGAPRPAESDKPVDCFYVYPTVTNQVALNVDPGIAPEVASIAQFQASRFADTCRVFAPSYRQVPLLGLPLALTFVDGPLELAYSDVRAAWQDYLEHENNGRGVIFIGHSQGSMMLRKLIREEIDPNPALREQLVGAFLMGGNVTTAAGSTVGGDFEHIPLCTAQGEAGCVTAYSTELLGVPSGFGNSDLDLLSFRMGLPMGQGFEVACTDPAVLSGDAGAVGVTVPSDRFALGFISVFMDYTTFPEPLPTSDSSWTTSRGRGVGQCVDYLGFRMYRVSLTVQQQINELPLFATHLLDINFGLDRLVSIADQQTASWLG